MNKPSATPFHAFLVLSVLFSQKKEKICSYKHQKNRLQNRLYPSVCENQEDGEKTTENTEKPDPKPTPQKIPKSKLTYPLSPHIFKAAAFCKKNTTFPGIAVELHRDWQIMDELLATQKSFTQVLIFHANKWHTLYLQCINKESNCIYPFHRNNIFFLKM